MYSGRNFTPSWRNSVSVVAGFPVIQERLHAHGTLRFSQRLPLLIPRISEAGQRGHQQYRGCGEAAMIAPYELRRTVEHRLFTGQHGTTVEITPDVGGEVVHPRVSILR
jgi:hypothetical protein